MQEYEVEIEKILQRTIKVQAKSKEEAVTIVKEKYRNEEIVLTVDDFIDVEFK